MSQLSIWTPIIYIGVLLSAYAVLSKVHRRRRARKLASTTQFYPQDYAKDIFFAIKDLNAAGDVTVPAKLQNAALLGWAGDGVARLMRMRAAEPSVTSLHQRGSVGDAFFERYTGSMKLAEQELHGIATEAVKLNPEWTYALQTGTEVAQHAAIHRRMAQIETFKQEYLDMAGASATDATNDIRVRLPTAKAKK